ncbi:squalene synthase HpnC [Pelagibius sp. Alg239-R121]|uniref:squalene synthase HpnC n=1 Tax=Pelagibius sp. Alg239-R121 TaxID=2993448 RepID=UPI0024A6A48A|nr:squalene synthase HpnC [Pelagibius sp. Alg239-R121]
MPHSPKPQAIPSSPTELTSGKTARDENFPVGSWLIEARLRPHIMTYYRFARAADNIADNPDLAAGDKISLLSLFEDRLTNAADREKDVVADMRQSLAATAIAPVRCLDLLYAFMQDARKSRRESWDDLLDYCRLSANPVGRYLLDLHGEEPAAYVASDALCSALQVLNHLQDCGKDYRQLNRVYLPMDWLTSQGLTEEVLRSDRTPPALRRVINLCLDGVDSLLEDAVSLPRQMKNRGLSMESAVILRLALRLSARLRKEDPLAVNVSLSKLDFLICALRGILAVLAGRLLGSRNAPDIETAGPHG